MTIPMIAPDIPLTIATPVLDDEVDDDDGEDGGTEGGLVLPEPIGTGVSGVTTVGGTLTGDTVSKPRPDDDGKGVGTVDSTANEEGCGEDPEEDSEVDCWKEEGAGVVIGVETSNGVFVGETVEYELLSDSVLSIMMTAKSVSPAETFTQSPLTFPPKTTLSPLLATSVIQSKSEVPS